MSNTTEDPLTSILRDVIDLLVESRIKLDALEQVLKETNPLTYEFYVGTIENLQMQRAAELKQRFSLKR